MRFALNAYSVFPLSDKNSTVYVVNYNFNVSDKSINDTFAFHSINYLWHTVENRKHGRR